jgi:amino acid transporter
MSETAIELFNEELESGALRREIGWTHSIWAATGAPALVLFSIGGIAATVGSPSWLVWVVSIVIGAFQMFTYAEVAGMFAHKSGGTAVSGSLAWLPYGKVFPALSVWNYWLGWTPVVAIGTAIASGYILTALVPASSPVMTWQYTLLDLGFIQDKLTMRVNAAFVLSVLMVLVCFAIQHGGILRASRMQMIMATASLVPLGLVGIVPLLTGRAPLSNFLPFVPLAHDAAGNVIPGSWNMAGITLFAGGLFIAGWSTYGMETCLVYTREFRNPARDTVKAALGTTLVCLFFYALVPISFQGALGLKGLLDPGIYDGSGVAAAMARMVGLTGLAANIIVVMLLLTLVLSILTAIAGSSRTLYQASVDGFLPAYLSKTNAHGVPMRAMWTDLCFNIILLTLSNNVFLLAISNVCYMAFIFFNLQSGWIHRLDRAAWTRPYRAPRWLIATGAACGFFDMFLIGMGADAYGAGVLKSGLAAMFAILPVFLYRHYVRDRGVFPPELAADMQPGTAVPPVVAKAGILPYLALAGGAALVWLGHHVAVY